MDLNASIVDPLASGLHSLLSVSAAQSIFAVTDGPPAQQDEHPLS